MTIRDFELYHGAVLTKILRSDRPVALRLIETRPGENWSTYTLNDEVDLFISHSKAPRSVTREGGGTSWTFVLSRNQIRQLNPAKRGRDVFAALVCGRADSSGGPMHVCLLDPQQVADLVDFSAAQQALTVRKPARRGKLRVFKDRHERYLVAQSRLDRWEVPGG